MKILFAVLLLFGHHFCMAQKKSKQKNAPLSCASFLKIYGEYWQKDSVGDTGFRLLAIESIKGSCPLIVGQDWDQYKAFFGNGNASGNIDEDQFFTYNLTNYPRAYSLSNKYLYIIIDTKGKIKRFFDWIPG